MSPETTGASSAGPAGLAQLQLGFVREVLYRENPDLATQVVAGPEDGARSSAARRIGIYRSNARENHADALAAAFPLLESCVGPQEFRQLAWSFQRAHPSRAGNLFHIGRALVGFLGEHVRGSADEYLVDVAGLEWMVQESLVAADSEVVMDLARLAAVPADRQGSLKLEFHPSVGLLASDHAIFQLWEAHQANRHAGIGAATAPPAVRPLSIPPARATEHLLVQRQADGVRLHRLPERDYRWLLAMKQGASLADSDECDSTTLAGLLQAWMQQGVVTGFLLPETAG